MTSLRDFTTFPAGEARTGFFIAAALTALAQAGVVGDGAARGSTLALHAVCAGLAYLFLLNVSKRKLGAPLIGAVLFGAHPSAAATLVADGAPRVVGGTALAFLAGVLLARTPLDRRLLWPALAAYAASLPLAPGAAAVPFLVAAGAVAYHGLEPGKLLTKRLAPRFAAFLVPLAAWAVWSACDGPGRGFGAAGGDFVSMVVPFARPLRLVDVFGIGAAASLLAVGIGGLRSWPKAAWPLLGVGLSLVAAATLRDGWGAGASSYAAVAFAAAAAAEGIEEIYYRFGGAAAAPLMIVVYAALAVLSRSVVRA